MLAKHVFKMNRIKKKTTKIYIVSINSSLLWRPSKDASTFHTIRKYANQPQQKMQIHFLDQRDNS